MPRRPLLALLALPFLATCAGKLPPPPPWKGDVVTSSKWHFAQVPDNGLKVVVMPDASAPTTTIVVRFPIGAKDDPHDRPGLAHLVEHTMFLQRPGGGDTVFDRLGDLAVEYNAETTVDSTTYITRVLPGDLAAALTLDRTLFDDPCATVDPARFETEREVVLNELRVRGQDDPGIDFHDLVPDSHAPGGTEATVTGATLDDACGFARDHYTPANAVVVIAGPVDIAEAQRAALAAFGDVPLAAFTAPADPPHGAGAFQGEAVSAGWDTDRTVVRVEYQLPTTAGVLGEDEKTRLLYVMSAGVGTKMTWPSWLDGTPSDDLSSAVGAPMLSVTFLVKDGAEANIDGLAASIHQAVGGDVYQWGHSRDTNLTTQEVYESVEARAQRFAELIAAVPPEHVGDYFRTDPETDAQLQQRVVDATDPSHARIVVLTPRPGHVRHSVGRAQALPGTSEVVRSLHEHRTVADLALPALTRPASHERRLTLPDGLRVVIEDTGAASPIVSTLLRVDVGSADDPPGAPGTAYAAEVSYYGPTGVAHEHFSVADDATYFLVTGLARDLPAALRDEQELAYHPTYQREKVTVDDDAMSDPDVILRRRLFGADHPYGRPPKPPSKKLLEEGGSGAFRRRWYRPDLAELYLVGHLDLDATEQQVRYYFADWKAARDPAPTHNPAPITTRAGVVALIDPDAGAQVDLHLAFATPAETDADRPIRAVLTKVLEERAFALREQQGVTYTPSVERDALRQGGYVHLEVSVDARYAGGSLQTLESLIADLGGAGPTDDELARARRAVIRNVLGAGGTSEERAIDLATRDAHGTHDSDDAFLRAVATVSATDVREMAARELTHSSQVTIVAGTADAVKRALAASKHTADETVNAKQDE